MERRERLVNVFLDGSRKRGRNIMNHHKCILLIVLFIFVLIPNHINAWTLFGPKTADDCILKYQKTAKCQQASLIINFSCRCKFKPEYDPLSLFKECNYNPDVYDCILDNIGDAQNDQAAVAISTSCINKYNTFENRFKKE
jgi:hypothetical protein